MSLLQLPVLEPRFFRKLPQQFAVKAPDQKSASEPNPAEPVHDPQPPCKPPVLNNDGSGRIAQCSHECLLGPDSSHLGFELRSKVIFVDAFAGLGDHGAPPHRTSA